MAKKNPNDKNLNNYKIEALEPRLMMDGNQWGDEIQSSVYYAVGSASLGVAAQEIVVGWKRDLCVGLSVFRCLPDWRENG